jgi:hypothetical protein
MKPFPHFSLRMVVEKALNIWISQRLEAGHGAACASRTADAKTIAHGGGDM